MMSDTNMITPGEGGHIREELSAYIDGALDAAERESVRLHLEGCEPCRTDYEELLATQTILRSVPVVVPPRAFTLTEEMVAPPRREGFWEKLLSQRNGSRLATGSILSFALVAMLLVGNLGLLGSVNSTFSRIGSAVSSESLSRLEDRGPGETRNDTEFTPDTSLKEPLPVELSQGAAAPTQTTAASSAGPDAVIPAMATNLPEAMLMPTATTAAAEGMGGAIGTEEATANAAGSAPTPTTGAGWSGAQATTTQVPLSASVMATATAVSSASNLQIIQATVEAQGRAPSMPLASRPESPLLDEPTGDGRGIYYGLIVLFLTLGVLLGVGALVARRRGSH